jgi:Tol biopolymer transport system component
VDRDNANLHRLTADLGEEIAPAWSPDGTRLAYATWTPHQRKWEVWVLAVDSREPRRFVAAGMFPAWSPDGRRIALQRQSQSEARRFGIWLIEFDGVRSTGECELTPRGDESFVAPCWSPDGAMLACIAAARSGQRTRLVVVDAETGRIEPRFAGPATAMSPRWARDGTLYFVQSAAGRESVWCLATAQFPSAGARGRVNRPLANGGDD